MHSNIPIFIPHLGCPFHCIFCDQKKISSQHQVPDTNEAASIIKEHLATLPPDADIEIAFFGGNFTSLPVTLQEEYLKTAQPYIKSGRVQSIRVSTRPDFIDGKVLERLCHYGVETVELGVQSLNEDVLKKSGRGYSAAQVEAAALLIKEFKMKLGIQLMAGLPGDNRDAINETVALVIGLKPDMVRIYPTLVIEGTALENMYRTGEYSPLTLSEAVHTVAGMYARFRHHNILVIRMGLQPSEDLLQPGTVVAGPFHPAFGELVKQELYRQQAEEAIHRYINQYGAANHVVLFVNYREVSKLTGYKKTNLQYLTSAFNLDNITVKPVRSNEHNFIGVAVSSGDSPEVVLTEAEFLAGITGKGF